MNATHRPPTSKILVTTGAIIATLSAYFAIVNFAMDVLEMNPAMAYALAGVFEICMLSIGMLAQDAVKQGRPHLPLSILVFAMACTTGAFAGWEEIHAGHPIAAAVFRFLVAVSAALMWELALIGDKHLASGLTWTELRRQRRMWAFIEAIEARHRANDKGRRHARDAAERAFIRARSRVRRVCTPAELSALMTAAEAQDITQTALIISTRNGHSRQTAAFGATSADSSVTYVPVTQPQANATPTPTVEKPTPTLTPVPSVATVAARDNATQPTTVKVPTVNATVPSSSEPRGTRFCFTCGKPLPATASSRAKYCQNRLPDGQIDQKCKNEGQKIMARQRAAQAISDAATA